MPQPRLAAAAATLLPRLGRCLCHAAAAATPRRGWLTGCRAAPRRFYNPNGDYDDADKEELVEECKASGEEVVRSAQPCVSFVAARTRAPPRSHRPRTAAPAPPCRGARASVLTHAAVRSQRIQERPIIAKFLYHARLKADEARAGPVAMYSR